MNSYVQTSGKVPWSARKRLSLCVAPVGLRRETRSANHYIVACPGPAGLRNGQGSTTSLDVVQWSPGGSTRLLDRKTRILKGLGERLRAGNFFLPVQSYSPGVHT